MDRAVVPQFEGKRVLVKPVARTNSRMNKEAIHGAILGSVIGDALGLPYEALSRRRAEQLLGSPNRHRFVFGRGMMSDDGEHTCMVAQALAESGGDPDQFQRAFARRLRWWLLGIPAGIGGATLRSVLKLWIGIPPTKSGVHSAGNGPAMRSAVIGAASTDLNQLRHIVTASTLTTHTDPKAFHGAMTVAFAARCSAEGVTDDAFMDIVRRELVANGADELIALLDQARESVRSGHATSSFAAEIGSASGVSGYIMQTVPVAIHAWLRHPTSFDAAIGEAIACGGDTDTVASIVGGIVGCRVGVQGIPDAWQRGLFEWPRSLQWIDALATAVHTSTSDGKSVTVPRVSPLVLIRNVFFLLIVLAHIGRRALPPY